MNSPRIGIKADNIQSLPYCLWQCIQQSMQQRPVTAGRVKNPDESFVR